MENFNPWNVISDTDEMEFYSDSGSALEDDLLFIPIPRAREDLGSPTSTPNGVPQDNVEEAQQEPAARIPVTASPRHEDSSNDFVNPPVELNFEYPLPTANVDSPKSSMKDLQPKESPRKDDEDGQTCSICFESWSISGEHRLASLKCGHIFGKCCIEKWLKAQGSGSRCPQCNAKALKKDIRVLYVKTLKALDTSEKDKLTNELNKVRAEKDELAKEHAQAILKSELNIQLVKKLQEELKMLKASVSKRDIEIDSVLSSSKCANTKMFKLAHYLTMCVNKDGDCRVMAINNWMQMLIVSAPSQVSMFPGYGIRKINALEMKPERYLPLHQKQIRDLSFNPHKQNLLLSVAMDKFVKITNVESNATVQAYETNSPLWSCCWNTERTHEFFVGTSSGRVLHFDTTNTDGPIHTYDVCGSGSIVSLSYISKCTKTFPKSGLLVTKLCSICFVELLGDGTIKNYELPIEGVFTNTNFDPALYHFLVTSRPSQRSPHARHALYQLACVNVNESAFSSTSLVSSNEVHCFQGGTSITVLSRADKIIKNPARKECILICEESASCAKLYELDSSSLIQKIHLNDTILDTTCIYSGDKCYLAFLTSKGVTIYRWVEQL